MHPALAQHLADADRFSTTVSAVDRAAAWSSPSPCQDWDAAAVLDHVVDTQRDFLAGRDVDTGPRPAGGPAAVWGEHQALVRRVAADDDLVGAPYDGYFGPTTLAATLRDFYGFDLLVHRWDLGRAAGLDVTWDDREADAVEQALDGFGDSLYMEGICRPAVTPPAGASRQTRLLARTGRQA